VEPPNVSKRSTLYSDELEAFDGEQPLLGSDHVNKSSEDRQSEQTSDSSMQWRSIWQKALTVAL
jgi:hypothetical protein